MRHWHSGFRRLPIEWFPNPLLTANQRASVDTYIVYTYYVYMNVTLSVDDETIQKARRRAEAMGTSVNQLVREYLEVLAGQTDGKADAAEFARLSRTSHGDSRGWKFNREELHERR